MACITDTRVHDQVMWFRHAGASNIKEIKGTTVNLKSSKYMYIDKSESESMHKKTVSRAKVQINMR